MLEVWFGLQVTEKFAGLARLELIWSCWMNNRPPSYCADRQQKITQWLGVQQESGTSGDRGHRGVQNPQVTGACTGTDYLVFDHLDHRCYMQAVGNLPRES